MSGRIRLETGTESSCLYCKKVYAVQPSGSQFCSRKCYLDHHSAVARKAHTLNCKHCGKAFYRPPSRQIGGFCSMRCWGDFKTVSSNTTCPNCGGHKAWSRVKLCRACWRKAKLRQECYLVCDHCGKNFYRHSWLSTQRRRPKSGKGYGVFCSLKCSGKAQRGKRNHFYVNGNHANRYPPEFWTIQPTIIERENNRCFICLSEPKKLDVHHIDRDTTNNEPCNLVALCRKCHYQQHDHLTKGMNRITAEAFAQTLSWQLCARRGYPMRSITLKS